MNKFPILINQDDVRAKFGIAGDGFPTRIVLKEGNGKRATFLKA